jgi:uncharacterized protein (TIGR03083 family)
MQRFAAGMCRSLPAPLGLQSTLLVPAGSTSAHETAAGRPAGLHIAEHRMSGLGRTVLGMTPSAPTTEQQLTAITQHSAGFAAAVEGHFDAPVEHCPGWAVADLVAHVTEVHWFWTTIARERPEHEPAADDPRRSQKLDDEVAALRRFRTGATAMVDVLRATDQSAQCWTWAPAQQDVSFITRHQVQEIAVHHWDAANAIGSRIVIDPAVAADSVTEFLTFSVSSESDAAPAGRGSLTGSFALRSADTGTVWTIHPGQKPATVAFESARPDRGDRQAGTPVVEAIAADLLLWLYGRVDLNHAAVNPALLDQFRELCFTD